MASADQVQSANRRPWYRFTLAGFLILILGVGVTLARARMKGVQWPDPIFTVFAVWFVVGMIQVASRELQSPSVSSSGSTPESPGFLKVAGAAFAILLLGIAGFLHLDRQVHWLRPASLDSVQALAASSAVAFLFYAGIICGYPDVFMSHPRSVKQSTVLNLLISCATWLLAGIWLSIVLWNTGFIAALVHTAIHGIRLNQPYRRTGVEIYPFPYPEHWTRQFLLGAAIAASLAVLAGALVVILSQARHHKSPRRSYLSAAWAFVVLANAVLLGWCYLELLPLWSPIVAPFLFAEPFAIGLAVLLLLVASMLFAARTATVFQLVVDAPPAPNQSVPLLHRRTAVMVLFLAAVIWSATSSPEAGWAPEVTDLQSAWNWVKYTAEYHVMESSQLVKIAAFLCVITALWRTWRPAAEPTYAASIDASRFMTMWGMWFITGLVAIPAFAWFGVSLMFW